MPFNMHLASNNSLAKKYIFTVIIVLLVSLLCVNAGSWKRREDKTKCPKVKGIKNFDITGVSLKTIKKKFLYQKTTKTSDYIFRPVVFYSRTVS